MDTISKNTVSSSKVIKPIDKKSVHRICSGQVVLSLAIAVKELVENAIDAGATNIEVKLQDYGAQSIQVHDNGSGVHEDNFQYLTLRYHTSKLEKFSDLESVETLGFRGEALSSLCALSEVSVTTKHFSADYATKLNYDSNGIISDRSPAARDVGTTVCLQNLFANLPVRRKELLRNLKKEFQKMCQILYAYCLVCKEIRISCSNKLNKGKKNMVVFTQSNATIRDNIVSVFGPEQVKNLIQIEAVEPSETVLAEMGLQLEEGYNRLKFDCLISSAVHGCGRSTTDRQFYYINDRPCESSKIAKTINESYKQFNSHQYPFVFLNIKMERSLVDVNVTPDKRQMFLNKEKLLLAVLKSSVLEGLKDCSSTYQIQAIQKSSAEDNPNEIVRKKSPNMKVKDIASFFDSFKKKPDVKKIANETVNKQASLVSNKKFKISIENSKQDETIEHREKTIELHQEKPIELGQESNISITNSHEQEEQIGFPNKQDLDDETPQSRHFENVDCLKEESSTTSDQNEKSPIEKISDNKDCVEEGEDLAVDYELAQASIEPIKKYYNQLKSRQQEICPNPELMVRFKCKLEPEANEAAEKELQKHITKDMFKKMKILGQYNLAFIITKLDNDLFIIDQHASDEKYNFELLQETTALKSQPLIDRKPLQFTAANEELLIDNIEIFKKNGFEFEIDRDAPATRRIFLTATPASKNCVFGKDEIDEILFLLHGSIKPAMCRPSRIRALLASRACRKAIMIGESLNEVTMREVVNNLGKIKQPWNCPHGRPTMRHLINLDLIDFK